MDTKVPVDIRNDCAKVFAVIDTSGRGLISRDDLIRAFRLLNQNPTDEDIRHILQNSSNTEFSFEEFLTCVTQKSRLLPVDERREELRKALSIFDPTNSGFLSKELLIDILTKSGNMSEQEEQVIACVQQLDRRKDGQIRIAELEELFIRDEDTQTILNERTWDLV